MVTHGRRDRDAAWPRDALKPCRDVHAVAEDVVILHDHVAEIDTDAKLDAPPLGHRSVALRHATLDFGGACDGVHDARKLNQHPVTGALDDTSFVLGDL